MGNPVDETALQEFHDALVEARDAAAEAINQLDANPPDSEDEFLAEKTRLMTLWRTLSIARIQVEDES